MTTSTKTHGLTVHRLAGVLYWASLLLLLAGMWVLIDPYRHSCGETVQIYVTLGAFEVYVWLLLGLGRWQLGKGLIRDTARSGLFAVVLTGLLFIALNELHVASSTGACAVAVVAVILAVAKLGVARQWFGLTMPRPLLVLSAVWVIVLAVPAPLFQALSSDRSLQHQVAFLACWLVALFVGSHLLLVAWQVRRGFGGNDRPLGQWWVPWLVVAVFAGVTTAQLHSLMYGLFVDSARWYFTPIAVAAGVVAVALGHACGRRYREAWGVLSLAMLYGLWALPSPMPRALRLWKLTWLGSWVDYVAHPVYPNVALACVLFVVAGWVAGRWWLASVALIAPTMASTVKGGQAMSGWRHGKGTAMLLGAFVLLGLAAAVQWWQERRSVARLAHLPAPGPQEGDRDERDWGWVDQDWSDANGDPSPSPYAPPGPTDPAAPGA